MSNGRIVLRISTPCCNSLLVEFWGCYTIDAGWSEGVKVGQTDEEIQAILVTAQDYDPECKSTFMSAFDGFFVKSYPHVEKLVESFRLPLGDLQNMWSKGEGPTVGGGAANA
ncbi:hypothetical protein Tco_0986289 [Tanacetum coccineum]